MIVCSNDLSLDVDVGGAPLSLFLAPAPLVVVYRSVMAFVMCAGVGHCFLVQKNGEEEEGGEAEAQYAAAARLFGCR